MALHIRCSLILATAFYLSAAQYVPQSVAANPALQMRQPTKSGNVPHINEEEQPIAPPKVTLDPAQLHREGQELLDLAQSLQTDIESLNHGLHPKDVIDKLKRIQKLAKHLKGEIEP